MSRACLHHPIPQPQICKVCADHVAAQRSRSRPLIIGALLIVPVAGVAGYLMTRPKPPPPVVEPGEPDTVVRLQRERLAKTPCEPRTSINMVERLMELKRWRDAKDAAEASLRECGVIGKMRWRLAYANQQLLNWPGVIDTVTELIIEQPSDSDFWWWRGEAYAESAQSAAAIADYRQSLAVSTRGQGAQFAANRILKPAKTTGALCEASRAWTYYVRAFEAKPLQDIRDEAAALARNKTCAPEDGTGQLALSGPVRAMIGSTGGTFNFDPELGTTLVAKTFLRKAGLEVPTAGEASALLGEAVVSGIPMRVTLRAGNALAANVDILATDDLAGDTAGVLGLSFFWHFDIEYRDENTNLLLTPLTPQTF